MPITFKQLRLLILLPLLTFCGAGPTIQINLGGTTAFADTSVRDIVFVFQSQSSAEGVLDQDGNGQPDFFVYPSQCGAQLPAGCGFSPNPGSITVGELPLDYSYAVLVRLRSAAGATLYQGQANFTNTKDAGAINIAVQ